MRLFTQEVFNQQIVGTADNYSDPSFNALLGSAEKLVIQVLADQASGTSPTATVSVECSNDNRNWVAKTGSPPIDAGALSTTNFKTLLGHDDGSSPNAAFVRLRITLGGVSPSSKVRVIACGRAEQAGM